MNARSTTPIHTTYTFPAGALRGRTGEPLTVPAFRVGPFVVHRTIAFENADPKRLGWRCTHAMLGAAAHTYPFAKRKHALAYANWLIATGIEWNALDISTITENCRRYGISRIVEAARAIELDRTPSDASHAENTLAPCAACC